MHASMAKKTKAATEEAAAKPAAKTKAETKEKAPVEPTEQPEEKTTRTRGKRTKDEIDDIFNSKPAKKAAKGSEEAPEAEAPTEEDAAALAKLAEKVKDARKKHEVRRLNAIILKLAAADACMGQDSPCSRRGQRCSSPCLAPVVGCIACSGLQPVTPSASTLPGAGSGSSELA